MCAAVTVTVNVCCSRCHCVSIRVAPARYHHEDLIVSEHGDRVYIIDDGAVSLLVAQRTSLVRSNSAVQVSKNYY